MHTRRPIGVYPLQGSPPARIRVGFRATLQQASNAFTMALIRGQVQWCAVWKRARGLSGRMLLRRCATRCTYRSSRSLALTSVRFKGPASFASSPSHAARASLLSCFGCTAS